MMTARALICGSLALSFATLVPQMSLAQSVNVGHTSVDVSRIPSTNITAAQALRMSFSHASVGGNIWSGLQTLASDSKYAFPNWEENNRGNPGWQAKVTQFETWVADHVSEFDVFQNKFCYIDQDADFATYRDSMKKLVTTYPAKAFVWWTIPIMTDGSDNSKRQSFNQQVRSYCAANTCLLFDIADIESHKTDGTAVTNSGVEALDPDQSSDGGHLSDLGAARAAQAQWALMAQIAGWRAVLPNGTGGTSSVNTAAAGGNTTTSAVGNGNDSSGCSVASVGTSSRRAMGGVLLLGVVLAACRRIHSRPRSVVR